MLMDNSEGEVVNRYYLCRFFGVFPRFMSCYLWALVFFSLFFLFSGFGIIYDSVLGVFPGELRLLRDLFVWNWAMCFYYSVVSIYLSRRFYRVMFRWINGQDFVSNVDVKATLKNDVCRFLNLGFGWIPLTFFTVIYVSRFFIMSLMTPSPLEFGAAYRLWYLGGDIAVNYVFLCALWSLILFSAILRWVAGAYPIRINDLADYKERFKDLVGQANWHLSVLGLIMATFFFGILYWSFSVGTVQYYLAAVFLLFLAGVSVSLVFWLNFSGINEGLEKTKRAKIASIRSSALSWEFKDLQISLHSQVSIWSVGTKVWESLLRPLIIAEIPLIAQSIIEFFRIISS